jgi:hypothetical protein
MGKIFYEIRITELNKSSPSIKQKLILNNNKNQNP